MDQSFEQLLRDRITELRMSKNLSEHRMSLELDKSGSYIRSITNGNSLPSVKELFNIISYFDMTPAEFFRNMDDPSSPRALLNEKLMTLSDDDLEKVRQFVDWITEQKNS